jgi:hypothetical protein
VILFAQDGIDENVMLVPLVDACAVPDTIGYNVPVVAATVPELVMLPLEIVPVVMLPSVPVKEDVPATVRLLPTATLPLESLTRLIVALEGCWTLIVLIVDMLVCSQRSYLSRERCKLRLKLFKGWLGGDSRSSRSSRSKRCRLFLRGEGDYGDFAGLSVENNVFHQFHP